LNLTGFDLSLTGFGDLELKDLLAERTGGLTDPDDAPAAPEHPVSQTGDLWTLGKPSFALRRPLASDQGRTSQPLRSSPITGPSTLLQAAPPLRPASVLSPSRLEPLSLIGLRSPHFL
jgi:hypothetical protein